MHLKGKINDSNHRTAAFCSSHMYSGLHNKGVMSYCNSQHWNIPETAWISRQSANKLQVREIPKVCPVLSGGWGFQSLVYPHTLSRDHLGVFSVFQLVSMAVDIPYTSITAVSPLWRWPIRALACYTRYTKYTRFTYVNNGRKAS